MSRSNSVCVRTFLITRICAEPIRENGAQRKRFPKINTRLPTRPWNEKNQRNMLIHPPLHRLSPSSPKLLCGAVSNEHEVEFLSRNVALSAASHLNLSRCDGAGEGRGISPSCFAESDTPAYNPAITWLQENAIGLVRIMIRSKS
jgi:hypothetical protein